MTDDQELPILVTVDKKLFWNNLKTLEGKDLSVQWEMECHMRDILRISTVAS